VARDLVASHGAKRCLRCADALEVQRDIRNRAGWLRRAIEEGYELPDTLPLPEAPAETPSPLPRADDDTVHDPLVAEPKKLPGAPLSQAPNQEEPLEDEPALDPRAIKAWDSLVKDLVVLRGRDSLPPWFDQFKGAQLEGTALTVLVPNSTAANHLNEHFGGDLVRLWLERAGTDAILQVTTALGSSKRAALTG
jgi:hypothetical protein